MKNTLDMAEVRSKLGITQQVLADMLDVDRKYVSMVETGTKPLSKKLAVKLARIAEIEVHKREQSGTTSPDGSVKNLHVKETGNPYAGLSSSCANCARFEAEIVFLRARLSEALARIPKPKDF